MKKFVKFIVFSISIFLVFPMTILVYLEYLLFKTESFFQGFGQLIAIIPWRIGVFLRASYYFSTLKHCDTNVSIAFGTLIPHRDVQIGRYVVIGAYCIIGKSIIGDNVLIGSRVSLLSGKYQHILQPQSDDNLFKWAQGEFSHIQIGSNCWLGEASVILADIGDNSIVGAGSVVFNKIKENSKVAGNPARSIKFLE